MLTSFIYDCIPRFVQSCVLNASRSTGKERDTESGLDYFGARYYASSMGRWMSPDWADKPEAVPYSKLDNPQSLNLYGYVLNNPLSKADPDGHASCPPDCSDPTLATAVAPPPPSLLEKFMDFNQKFLGLCGSTRLVTKNLHARVVEDLPAPTKCWSSLFMPTNHSALSEQCTASVEYVQRN